MPDSVEQRERVRRQFNRQAEAYTEYVADADQRVIDFLVSLAAPTASERVLDVACGPARLTLALAEKAEVTVGIDVTDRLLATAREAAAARGIASACFAQADVESLPLADESFDVTTCKFALHHFPRPARVVAEMRRVTRPGGRIVLIDMASSEDPAKAELHNRIERLCDPTHVRALPESELDALVSDAGLRVLAKRTGQVTEHFVRWIAHGGPPPEAVTEIERLLRSSIEADRTGLAVREEDGELVFDHTGATYLLERAACLTTKGGRGMSGEAKTPQAWVALGSEAEFRAAVGDQHPYDFGFIPAMGRLINAHDGIAPAFGGLFAQIMFGPSALSRREREMIAGVTSAAQDCHY